jgi:hypothetical protein
VKPIRHTIQCHCILPQYRNRPDPIFHKFVVFGCVDESDTLQTKYAQCNYCNSIHKIFDICKSEILVGKEDSRSIDSIDDIKTRLPIDINEVLESYDCDISTYEFVLYVMTNNAFPITITLTKDIMEEEVIGKKLVFDSNGKITIQSFSERFNEDI